MPLFFFDLHDDEITHDEEGHECADLGEARQHATFEARIMAAEEVLRGRLVTSHRIELLDAARVLLESFTFGQVVAIR